jgi:hypothetical protein
VNDLAIFLIGFAVLGLAVSGMAVGVMLTGRLIKGSCGGLNNIAGLEAECPICSGRCEKNPGGNDNAGFVESERLHGRQSGEL